MKTTIGQLQPGDVFRFRKSTERFMVLDRDQGAISDLRRRGSGTSTPDHYCWVVSLETSGISIVDRCTRVRKQVLGYTDAE